LIAALCRRDPATILQALAEGNASAAKVRQAIPVLVASEVP
jgi:hypothetical protein